MPHWDFECPVCEGRDIDVFGPRCDVESARPSCCGQPMETLWSGSGQPAVSSFEPYVTTHPHPEARPLEIRGKDDIARIQREYGVRLVDDPGLVMRDGKLDRKERSPGRHFDMGGE